MTERIDELLEKLEKLCGKCGKYKSRSQFSRDVSKPDGLQSWCKNCKTKYELERSHRKGIKQPMGENRDCACFLGIHVAESILSCIYENTKAMPYGNPGFDFICGRGYKVDVKSGCRRHREGRSDQWIFHIGKNRIADYFLCIAFDSRESLTPEHIWLIPGDDVRNMVGITISVVTLSRWEKWEQPIYPVLKACDVILHQGGIKCH